MRPAASVRSSRPACETAARMTTRGSAPGASAGSVGRDAAQSASCPPAECPTATTRDEIERRLEVGEEVDARSDVQEGRRPSAPRPDPPVLEIPCGEPVPGEVEAQIGHERAVVLRLPVAAVNDDDDREGSGARREEELPELARVGAVGVRRAGHAPGRIRTCGLALRRRALYPLSYGRGERQCIGVRLVYPAADVVGSGGAPRGCRADVHGHRHDRVLVDDRSQGVVRDRGARRSQASRC